jgi:hypothetical protein
MSDKRAARASRASRAVLLQTKELKELPLQSQRSCQNKIFFSQKIKSLKPKQNRERERERERERAKKLDNKWTRVNTWKCSRASSRGSVCKLLQRQEGGKRRAYCQKTRTGRRELVSDTQKLLIN